VNNTGAGISATAFIGLLLLNSNISEAAGAVRLGQLLEASFNSLALPVLKAP
jgi:hypothetical protein